MKNNRNGFTLVELIVVIVILAVLSAISFMMVTKWINKSSNARAASDVGTITRALHGYYSEKGIYPETSKPIGMLSSTGVLLGEQGVFDEEVIKSLGAFSKVPKDPKANDYYMYTKIKNPAKGFEVGAVFENPEISVLGSNVYADGAGNAIPYVQTTYQGKYYDELGSPIFPKPLSVFDQSSGKFLQESSIGVNGELVINMNQLTGKQLTSFSADGVMIGGEYGDFIVPKVGYTASGAVVGFSTGVIVQALPLGINAAVSTSSSSVSSSSSIDSTWCYYKGTALTNAHVSWTSSELYYNTGSNSCYVFGDENAETKAACNKWVTDNVILGGSWVWVPARWFVTDGNGTDLKNSFYQRNVTYNGHNYVCRGFAVMKYEAKFLGSQRTEADATRKARTCSDYATDNDTFCTSVEGGGITSSPENFPIGSIRSGEAIAACGTGGTYHLITSNERMTLTRNIEQQSTNWSSNTIGNGYIFVGHNDRLPTRVLQASVNDSLGYTGTSDTASAGDGGYNNYSSEIEQAYKGQKRTLQLSNGQIIWDLAGNVREYVNKSNNPSMSNVRGQAGGWDNNSFGLESMCSNGGWARFGWYGTDVNSIVACTYRIGTQNKSHYGPSGNWNANNGTGRIYAGSSEDRSNILLRGGTASLGPHAGIYTLALNRVATNQDTASGFRCAR